MKIACGDMTVEYGYDAAGNVTLLRIGEKETHYGYDSMGRISSESDSDGNITNYRYDLAGHLIELEENRKLTRSSFDASGNLLTVRENGKTAPTYRYEYNAINQLTAVYYEDGALSRYTYNAQGEQIGSEYIEVPLNAHGTAAPPAHGSFPRLRIDISGGGQSTVGKATSLIEKAKRVEKEAAAAATRATHSAPGSLAATQAKVAQQGASLAVSRAQSVYDGGVGGSGGGIISDWVDTISSGVQTAVSLCKDACAYANQAAAIGRNSPTAAVPNPRSSQYAQSPSVQATTRGSWACGKIFNNKSVSIYELAFDALSAYISYKSGYSDAVRRNIKTKALTLSSITELIFTGDTQATSRKYNQLLLELENHRNNTPNATWYAAGMVKGDTDLLTLEIILLCLSGGSSATIESGAIIKTGKDVLVAVGSAASSGAIVLEGGLGLAAIWNGSNLGRDISNLINLLQANGSHMLGENGTQVTSKTLWEDNKIGHIDVENPAPGRRPGQIHFQETNGDKWYYDTIQKALKYLGE